MLNLTVQRNMHAGPIIIASAQAQHGYTVLEMPADQVLSIAQDLDDLFNLILYHLTDYTVSFYMPAELIKVTPDTTFDQPTIVVPTLNATLMQEEHGWHYAYAITDPPLNPEPVVVPISRAHYYGLQPEGKEIMPTYHNQETEDADT